MDQEQRTVPDLPALNETPAGGDLFHVVDVSDTTESPQGTSKKVTRTNAVGGLASQASVDALQADYDVEHNADGTHKTATVTTLKATGGEVDTGTSDTKIVTPKALTDSSYAKEAYVDAAVAAAGILTTTKYAPQGFLINGKISTSVASNNLTVAIKGMDGNDPSGSNPVYVRIGNTVRTLTAALSVTLNAGTNYFGAGAAELATLEVDYFVYLVWKSSDSSLVLGFSRRCDGRLYSDFSSTNTSINYLAVSAAPGASDEVELIGRFNATLSASASFNWSMPATSIIVNRPIFETRWLTWTPTYTGFSANPTSDVSRYKIAPNRCHIMHDEGADGTSNSSSFTISLPFTRATVANLEIAIFFAGRDNGAGFTTNGFAHLPSGTTTLQLYKDPTGNTWTGGSTGKRARHINGSYDI